MDSLVDKIESFDLNRKSAIVFLLAIVVGWAVLSAVEELDFPHEDCMSFGKLAQYGMGTCTDYGQRLNFMYRYEDDHRWDNPLRTVTYELLFLSDNVFGDYRIIPFISSGFVLLLTFFLTNKLTGRNYTGLIAVLFVLHSPIFWKYDLILTYPNFWVSFLLASLWLTFNKWQLSPVSFIFGMSAKIINLLNLPAVLVFVALTHNENKKKILLTYGALIGAVIGIVLSSKFLYPSLWHKFYFIFLAQFNYQPIDFLWWLGMWAIELFSDKISLFMIFILIPCLFMLHKQKVRNSSAIMLMILIFILQPAFISGFTNYTNEDYRFLHLIVFLGIGLAFVIPNLKKLLKAFEQHFNLKKLS